MLQANVRESTATTGTGTVTLSSATGYARFSDAFAVGQAVSYSIEDGNNAEFGIGLVGASNTLQRTLVLATLSSGTYNKVNPTALTLSGSAVVYCAQHAGSVMAPFKSADLSVYSSQYANTIPSNMLSEFDYSNGALTANTAYFSPVLLMNNRPLTQLGVNVFTAAASKAVSIGIFDSDPTTGLPGNTLASITGLSVASTGEQMASLSSAVLLPPGWYWSGVVSNGTPNLMGPTLCMPGPLGMLLNRTARYFGRAMTYAAFGTSAMASASGSAGPVTNAAVPMVLLK